MASQSISPTRCCLYARISTTNGGQHPEMQLAELREHAQRRGWVVVGEFTDQISGSKDSRPALNKLMAQAHRREFDVVLVWKLDRWGRSLKHLVNSIAELEALGVAFVTLRDNLDLTTPSGRLMTHILGAMAEFVGESEQWLRWESSLHPLRYSAYFTRPACTLSVSSTRRQMANTAAFFCRVTRATTGLSSSHCRELLAPRCPSPKRKEGLYPLA